MVDLRILRIVEVEAEEEVELGSELVVVVLGVVSMPLMDILGTAKSNV